MFVTKKMEATQGAWLGRFCFWVPRKGPAERVFKFGGGVFTLLKAFGLEEGFYPTQRLSASLEKGCCDPTNWHRFGGGMFEI